MKNIFLNYASLVSLTRLSLSFHRFNRFFTEESIYQLEYLLQLTQLTHLDMKGVKFTFHEGHPHVTYLCQLLSVCSPKPSFPSLQTIQFIGKIKQWVSFDRVVQMARARTIAAASSPDGIVKLESVIFKECDPLTVDEYHQLQNALGHNGV